MKQLSPRWIFDFAFKFISFTTHKNGASLSKDQLHFCALSWFAVQDDLCVMKDRAVLYD